MEWKMLKKRIIPVQLLLDDRLVKTLNFDQYRDVGDPIQSAKVYSAQHADELIFLNINRNNRTIDPLLSLLEKLAEVCFMPLSLGGGIKTLDDVTSLIKHGADKVVLNSILYNGLDIVRNIADKFGSQSIVASIDIRRDDDENFFSLYSNCGRKKENIDLLELLYLLEKSGAGELFINSINNDGVMMGYDVALIKYVMDHTNLPVIACGGAGNYGHLKDAFAQSDVNALACGSMFNFGDNNPIRAKAFLSNYGFLFKKV